MLKSIFIQNFALLEEEKIEFTEGLNIITGETGAGKSIIMGAIALILGERVKPETIRTGKDFAVVEAEFLEGNQKTLIKREINLKGNNKILINGKNATLTELKELTKNLVDLHGQHEQQTLLNPETHIQSLDNFGKLEELVLQVKSNFLKINDLRQELISIKTNQKDFIQKKELLAFQKKELSEAKIKLSEDAELEKELEILQNSVEIKKMAFSISTKLYENENSIYEQLRTEAKTMNELGNLADEVNKYSSDIEAALTSISETAQFLNNFADSIEFSSEKLLEVQERSEFLESLKKKYKTDLNGLLSKLDLLEKEFSQEFSFEEQFKTTVKIYEETKQNYSALAKKLSEERQKTALEIEPFVVSVLAEVGMEKALFKILVHRYENPKGIAEIDGTRFISKENGIDEVEFYISANIGESLKPLVKIASGGEISRIMLALKTVIAKASLTPTLIFDEIDIGISGKVALSVGKALSKLAKNHQILCITHLPQIACQGETHFAVRKEIANNRTFTKVSLLDKEKRIYEIAKLISGEDVTETSLEAANLLLESSNSSHLQSVLEL
ncbi:DNA repair protein RecN [bacterium]|nr:DNA repair protein RecN [bacterium]